jgi:hypothetical protein
MSCNHLVILIILALSKILFAESEILKLESSQISGADPSCLAKDYFEIQCGVISVPTMHTLFEDAGFWGGSGIAGFYFVGAGYGMPVSSHIHIEPRIKIAFRNITINYVDYGITKKHRFFICSLGTSVRYSLKAYAPSLYTQAEFRLGFASGFPKIDMKSPTIGSDMGIGYTLIFLQRLIELELGYLALFVRATSDHFTDKIYNIGGVYLAFNVLF